MQCCPGSACGQRGRGSDSHIGRGDHELRCRSRRSGLDAVYPCRHPDCPDCSTPQRFRAGSPKTRIVGGSVSTMTNPFHEHRIRDAGRKWGEQPAQISYCDAGASARTHSGARPMRPVSASIRARPCGPLHDRGPRLSSRAQDPPSCAASPHPSSVRSLPRPPQPRRACA